MRFSPWALEGAKSYPMTEKLHQQKNRRYQTAQIALSDARLIVNIMKQKNNLLQSLAESKEIQEEPRLTVFLSYEWIVQLLFRIHAFQY